MFLAHDETDKLDMIRQIRCVLFISHPEFKIRREVMDWSAYHAATAASAVPRLRLNMSEAIGPRLSK